MKPTTPCWPFEGPLDDWGYGRYAKEGAHRVSYRRQFGDFPDEFEVDHLCFNPICIRPDHLEAVPREVNQARSRNRGATHTNGRKTFCKHGHPLTGTNLRVVVRPNGKVERHCAECRKRYQADQLTRIKLATLRDPYKFAQFCIHGHPLYGANLTISLATGSPKRLCRTCKATARKRYKERKKAGFV